MSDQNWTVGLIIVGIMGLIWSSHAPFWPCAIGTFASAFVLLVGLDRMYGEDVE